MVKGQDVDPGTALGQEVAAVLTHWVESNGLLVNAIRGYRNALGGC